MREALSDSKCEHHLLSGFLKTLNVSTSCCLDQLVREALSDSKCEHLLLSGFVGERDVERLKM